MSQERHEELAALRAFDLLDETERSAFAAESASNPEFARWADSLGETATHLALSAPQLAPPPALRSRILDAAIVPGETVVIESPWFRFIPWAAVATLAASTTWLGLQNFSLRTENSTLLTERRLAEVAYGSAQNQLAERSILAEGMINDLGRRLRHSEDLARLKVSALASLAGNTREAQAIAVWDPAQQAGLLAFDKLPVIPDDQDYQIWVVDPAYPNPVNGGVFKPDADGHAVLAFRPDQPVLRAAAFAISLEKKGGVPKAEGPIVLLGKLPGI
jgi:anti-sigma-K factor RskA